MCLPRLCTHQPGAVPLGLGIVSAEGMSVACLMLVIGHDHAPSFEHAPQPRQRFGVYRWGLTHGGCHRLPRQVVAGGAKSPARNGDIGPAKSPRECLGEVVDIVSNLRHPAYVDAGLGQFLRQEGSVGVHDLPHEELAPNSDYLSVHGPNRTGLSEALGGRTQLRLCVTAHCGVRGYSATRRRTTGEGINSRGAKSRRRTSPTPLLPSRHQP